MMNIEFRAALIIHHLMFIIRYSSALACFIRLNTISKKHPGVDHRKDSLNPKEHLRLSPIPAAAAKDYRKCLAEKGHAGHHAHRRRQVDLLPDSGAHF